MNDYPPALRALILLLLGFAVITALVLMQTLLVPLLLGILIAYMLYPTAETMEDHGWSRIATNAILVVGGFLVFLGLIYGLTVLIVSFSQDLSDIQQSFQETAKNFMGQVGAMIGVSQEQMNGVVSSLGESGEMLQQFFSATANTVVSIGLIPVYTFLMLFYRNKFKDFLFRISDERKHTVIEKIVDEAATIVPKYMKGLIIVCMILTVINSLGFFLIGVEYALLMGIIAAFFNLIPYLGTVIGYLIVLLFVLGTQAPTVAVGVVIQFVIVQFTENNILTPNITGSYVQINPLVTIFSLIAAGMIWGIAGMFMVIPYLAMLKIVCEHVDHLKPIEFLMSTRGTERYSFTWEGIREKLGFGTND